MAPFIVCDEYPSGEIQPDYFILSLDNGTAFNSVSQVMPSGGKRLYYDIGAVSNGSHRLTIKAIKTPSGGNAGGESTTVPFDFTKGGPLSPTGLKVIP